LTGLEDRIAAKLIQLILLILSILSILTRKCQWARTERSFWSAPVLWRFGASGGKAAEDCLSPRRFARPKARPGLGSRPQSAIARRPERRRAVGATTLQPRATPWDNVPNKHNPALKGRNPATGPQGGLSRAALSGRMISLVAEFPGRCPGLMSWGAVGADGPIRSGPPTALFAAVISPSPHRMERGPRSRAFAALEW